MKNMNNTELLKALEVPSGVIDAVLDTDAFNEVDDQYAIAYMLRSQERINTLAIYAAPFHNKKSTGPKDGMEKSYDEIKKVLRLCGREDMIEKTFTGSTQWLENEETPVESAAARDLVKKANEHSKENPLYVVAIGAITNVASAILMDKSIVDKIVIVWLGGHALHWDDNTEFNLRQDVAAARVIFGCGAPFVQLPCCGVVTGFTISLPELKEYFIGKTAISDYLAKNTIQDEIKYHADGNDPWARIIWDVTAVAWLLNDNQRFMRERIIHAPIPEYDNQYAIKESRHFMKYVYYINRTALLRDLIEKVCK